MGGAKGDVVAYRWRGSHKFSKGGGPGDVAILVYAAIEVGGEDLHAVILQVLVIEPPASPSGEDAHNKASTEREKFPDQSGGVVRWHVLTRLLEFGVEDLQTCGQSVHQCDMMTDADVRETYLG